MPCFALCAARAGLYTRRCGCSLTQTFLQIIPGRLDVRMHERAGFARFARAPCLEQRGMLARRAFCPAVGPQMRLHVTLRQGVQAAQDLGGNGLQTRHDEQQMIVTVELAEAPNSPAAVASLSRASAVRAAA